MITLDLPPQIEQTVQIYAKEQGISVNDYILSAIQAKMDYDDMPLFDIERMQNAIKGCESKEEVLKNGVSVSDWAMTDFESFQKWINDRKSARAM